MVVTIAETAFHKLSLSVGNSSFPWRLPATVLLLVYSHSVWTGLAKEGWVTFTSALTLSDEPSMPTEAPRPKVRQEQSSNRK
jgi:hypothetical protein